MRRPELHLSSLLLGLLAACSAGTPEAPADHARTAAFVSPSGFPAPTEHRLDERAEQRQKSGRKAWMEAMHRAAPGVDWRAIEEANGRREQERRNAIAADQLASGTLGAVASPWTEVGSSNQAGRMLSAVIGPDGQTLYAGSALGGLWRGGLDGSGWTPLGDNLYGGVPKLAVLPGEQAGQPDVVVIASGANVFVSRDQGLTWETPGGLGGATEVREVRVLEDAARTVLVLAQTSYLGDAPALFASTDWARTFVKRKQFASARKSGMWVPRAGPGAASDVYVSLGGQLHASTNGGSSFALRGSVSTSVSQSRLTGSEAGGPTLYMMALLAGTWGLHRSDDAGVSWAQVHTPSEYWGALGASIHDPNVVMYGGVECWRSSNGGATFSKINSWSAYYGDPANLLHADIQGIDCWPDPANPAQEIWYVSTDGGVYESRDFGLNPSNLSLSGLGVSQYYTTLTSASDPGLILAGSQDQGYQRGREQPSTGPGPSTSLAQLISGDYGHLTSKGGNHHLVYSTYPGFILVQQGQQNPTLLFPTLDFPAGSSHLWLPPVVADPVQGGTFYFLGDLLTRYDRISGPSWSNAPHSAQDFSIGGNYLTALAFAKADPQRVFAVNDGGRLFQSTDHGVTWQLSSSTAPGEHYFYGNAIAVHPTDPLEAAVGGSGYSTAGVIRTTDGGQTWFPEAAGLPSTLVYSLTYAPDGSGDLYCGTQTGAWRWERASGRWQSLTSNQAPITIYWSVETVGTDLVRYGTYGRGIWDYRIPPEHGAASYCTGKVHSQGCAGSMTWSGTPSASLPLSFDVGATQVVAGKNGILFYGYQPHAAPFQGGTLCVKSPLKRTPLQTSTGAPPPAVCSGSFAYDFNPRIQSGVDPNLRPGVRVYCQYWFRDPSALVSTTGLTDGLEFTILP
jgi:photosystem II stability/assembly factor-like uncharacterized protein